MSKSVVLDNTVLSNYARVGRAELVARLWPEAAFTTREVMNEYLQGVERGIFPSDAWTRLPIAESTAEEEAFCHTLSSSLGVGEKSCLAVAHHRQTVLATDDLDARKAAIRMGLPTTGTVGILVLCIRKRLLSLKDGNQVLGLMIERNYRSPVENLEQLL